MSDQILSLLADNGLLIGILIVIGLWFFVLRTRATRFDSKSEFDTMIAGGQPVVVEFFSNA